MPSSPPRAATARARSCARSGPSTPPLWPSRRRESCPRCLNRRSPCSVTSASLTRSWSPSSRGCRSCGHSAPCSPGMCLWPQLPCDAPPYLTGPKRGSLTLPRTLVLPPRRAGCPACWMPSASSSRCPARTPCSSEPCCTRSAMSPAARRMRSSWPRRTGWPSCWAACSRT